MIKITMTNGLAYVLKSFESEFPWPADDDDEDAWQYQLELFEAVKSALGRIGYSPNYYESILGALSNIPGVAKVEDLDPPPPDDDNDTDDDDEGLVIY